MVGDDKSNVISLAEWRRVQRRLDRMTLQELAMTTYQLIDLMIDQNSQLQDLQDRLETLEDD